MLRGREQCWWCGSAIQKAIVSRTSTQSLTNLWSLWADEICFLFNKVTNPHVEASHSLTTKAGFPLQVQVPNSNWMPVQWDLDLHVWLLPWAIIFPILPIEMNRNRSRYSMCVLWWHQTDRQCMSDQHIHFHRTCIGGFNLIKIATLEQKQNKTNNKKQQTELFTWTMRGKSSNVCLMRNRKMLGRTAAALETEPAAVNY